MPHDPDVDLTQPVPTDVTQRVTAGDAGCRGPGQRARLGRPHGPLGDGDRPRSRSSAKKSWRSRVSHGRGLVVGALVVGLGLGAVGGSAGTWAATHDNTTGTTADGTSRVRPRRRRRLRPARWPRRDAARAVVRRRTAPSRMAAPPVSSRRRGRHRRLHGPAARWRHRHRRLDGWVDRRERRRGERPDPRGPHPRQRPSGGSGGALTCVSDPRRGVHRPPAHVDTDSRRCRHWAAAEPCPANHRHVVIGSRGGSRMKIHRVLVGVAAGTLMASSLTVAPAMRSGTGRRRARRPGERLHGHHAPTCRSRCDATDPDGGPLQVRFEGRRRGATVPAPGAGSPFSIVALPDTQNYTYSNRQGTITQQAQWAVNTRTPAQHRDGRAARRPGQRVRQPDPVGVHLHRPRGDGHGGDAEHRRARKPRLRQRDGRLSPVRPVLPALAVHQRDLDPGLSPLRRLPGPEPLRARPGRPPEHGQLRPVHRGWPGLGRHQPRVGGPDADPRLGAQGARGLPRPARHRHDAQLPRAQRSAAHHGRAPGRHARRTRSGPTSSRSSARSSWC